MKIVKAYQCSYCGRVFLTQEQCWMHEDYQCTKNIYAFCCKDCGYRVNKGKGICMKGYKQSIKQFINCPDRDISINMRAN